MMEPFVRRFIRASLIWLGIGVLIGVVMSFAPGQALVYRPAHMHANLLGFVSMMIFGVAYHVIPRFTGNPLHDRRLAAVHLVVANVGLTGMVAGWSLRLALPGFAGVSLRVGSALSAVGALLFIYNLWRTLEPVVVPARPTPKGPALPVADPPSSGGGAAHPRLPLHPEAS